MSEQFVKLLAHRNASHSPVRRRTNVAWVRPINYGWTLGSSQDLDHLILGIWSGCSTKAGVNHV
jgi:hypothetical protein